MAENFDPQGRYVGEVDPSQIPGVESYIKGQFPSEDVALNQLVMEMRGREEEKLWLWKRQFVLDEKELNFKFVEVYRKV